MSKKKQHPYNIRQRGESWQVDCGTINEKRVQKSFKTKEDAETFAEQRYNEVCNNQIAVFELTQKHRMDALTAYEALAGGLNTEVSKLPSSGHSLKKAVEFYLKHAKPTGGEKKVSEIVEEYIKGKVSAGRRKRTIQDQRNRLNRFSKHFGQTPAHLVVTSDVEKWLDNNKYSGITRRNYRTHLVSFFNFARKRKYTSGNPVQDIEVPIIDEKTPEILSVKECQKLMMAAQYNAPEMVPYFAVALFAGLRPSETELLDWKYVDFDRKQIKVIPETAKKRRLRYVEMSDNLVAWLAPYRHDTGKLTYLRKRFDLVRKKAGIKWANDVLRHSYGSYHLAMHENANKTSLQMGHKGTDELFNHYRALVSKDEAKLFWEIRPLDQGCTIRMFA